MMVNNNKDDIKELIEYIDNDNKENEYISITDDEAKVLNTFISRFTLA